MPITLEHIAAKPFQEKLKAKGIRTWDTIQYLSALDGAYKDTVFHEQISNLPKDYIHLDEMARDEKEYSLNVFDFFFEPTSEIICDVIKSTLDFYYSNSPTFRRLVNYKVDYSMNNDIDTSKCEVKVSPNYSYENTEGDSVYLSLPFDKKGFPIDPGFHDCETRITSEKVFLDLFLKHLLYDELKMNYEATNIYSNVIFKEIDSPAMAHASLCFSQASVNDEYELFDIDSVAALPKTTEQIIFEGKKIQKEILSSFEREKNSQPTIIHKMERNIKNIAVTGLLLSSRLKIVDSDSIKNSNSEDNNKFSSSKEPLRYARALPEDHSAPNMEPHPLGQALDGIVKHSLFAAGLPLLEILKKLGDEQLMNNYKRGYHELLVFSQTGQWTHGGRRLAAEYMFNGLIIHLNEIEIILDNGRKVSFEYFVKEHIEHQYKIYRLIARDMLVHPFYIRSTISSLSPASRSGLHFLGTIWNIVMSFVPGFNALAGTSSILNRAIVENSADICGYVQDIIRIGMEAVPVAEAKFTERASNAKYTGLRFVESKIESGLIKPPIQKGSNYKVIESIEYTDFIYQKNNRKILELNPEGSDGLYRATGFDKETHGYYKQSGNGFYRKQKSFLPLSTEKPNTIKYGERDLVLTKEPGSETYQGTYSDTGKNAGMTFYRDSEGKFYKASGLKGGGLIRHIDKPYSELREGDIGYDEDLLDISDDSPLLEEMLPSLSEELYPTSEENVQSVYKNLQCGDTTAGEIEVVLCRGTTGPQAENIVKFKTAGGVEGADPNVLPVSVETAREQVRSGRVVPEFTTDLSVADRFSREHHLIIVKIKAKYLTRGSTSESGWVMPHTAPVEPVGIIDRTYGHAENIGQANASK